MYSSSNGHSNSHSMMSTGTLLPGACQLPGSGGSIAVSSWFFRVPPRMGMS